MTNNVCSKTCKNASECREASSLTSVACIISQDVPSAQRLMMLLSGIAQETCIRHESIPDGVKEPASVEARPDNRICGRVCANTEICEVAVRLERIRTAMSLDKSETDRGTVFARMINQHMKDVCAERVEL